MSVPRKLSKWSGVVGLAVIAVVAWVLLINGHGSGSAVAQAPSPGMTVVAQSEALSASVAPDLLGSDSIFSAGSAQQAAAQLASRVPLAEGKNFDDIVWSDATALGPISQADIEGYLEFNAACGWWTAAYADGRNAVAARLVQDIPQWPTFRGGDRHEMAVAVTAGGDALLNAALYCDQASRRARSVIAQRGHQ